MTTQRKQIITFILIGVVCIYLVSITGCKKKSEPTGSTMPKTTEVKEQKLCPIMDAPINKELFTEYKGKKVYFCCPGCKESFEKDPEKYLPKLPQFQ